MHTKSGNIGIKRFDRSINIELMIKLNCSMLSNLKSQKPVVVKSGAHT